MERDFSYLGTNLKERLDLLISQGYIEPTESNSYMTVVKVLKGPDAGKEHTFYSYSPTNDEYYYRLGVRRELSLQTIQKYISGVYKEQPWFTDIFDKLKEEYPDLKDFNREVLRLYRKRQAFVQDIDGNFKRKKVCRYIDVYNTQNILLYSAWVPRRWDREGSDLVPYNSTFYKLEDELDNHLFYTHYHNFSLFSIITEDFDICEEHSTFYPIGGVCPTCRETYRLYSYSENPLRHFNKTIINPKDIHLGIEIEVDTASTAHRLKETYNVLPNFVICKQDSSILGFEIVTKPASFDEHKEVFSKFPWKSHDISFRDGMHIHMDRSKLTELQIGKMYKFIYNPDNNQLMNKIAGRNIQKNAFCNNDSLKRFTLHYNLMSKSKPLQRYYDNSHSTALNYTSKGTLELRIFQTPKSYEEFLSKLEFTKALINFTKPGIISHAHAHIAEFFLKYLDKKTYPNLFNLLKEDILCA